jgi:hypothetical protein
VTSDPPSVELVENQRRSVAMLAPGAWALKREQALDLYAELIRALLDAKRLSGRGGE